MKVLVTGGAGYVGSELVKDLSNRGGYDIVVYDNLSRSQFGLFLDPRVNGRKLRFIRADILDSRSLGKALDGVEVVVHLAAKTATPFADEAAHAFDQTNHWGTSELCNAVERSAVKKLIYLSSISVYGCSDDLLSVEVRPRPDSQYGMSKYKGEAFVDRLGAKIDVSILRSANVYGYSPCMRFDSVMNRFVFEAHFYKRIGIEGNGKQYRGFIHLDDCIEVLAGTIEGQIAPGIYDMIGDNFRVIDIATTLKEIDPALEMVFANQGFPYRSQRVKPNEELCGLFKKTRRTLKEDIEEMKTKFSFSS